MADLFEAVDKYEHLDPEVKAKWLEGLRSGNYTQGQGRLKSTLPGEGPVRSPPMHCCLGVLCEVMGLTSNFDDRTGYWKYDFKDGTIQGNQLSKPFAEKVGLEQRAMGKLVAFNDNSKWGFKAIANWIEKYL